MNKISENYALRDRNTFGLEATAARWAEFRDTEELRPLIETCRTNRWPWYVVGGGSNLILTGRFSGLILHPTGTRITLLEPTLVRAEAGVVWDDLVVWSVDRGLGGLENLSAIPGSVGAAPVQNIGAYGSEAKDTIETVEYFDTERFETVRLPASACEFGYRESIFKGPLRGRAVITAVEFRLRPEEAPEGYTYNIRYGDLHDRVMSLGGPSLAHVRAAVTAIRNEKLPDPAVAGNAGSFFKNPVIPASQAEALKARYPDLPIHPTSSPSSVKIAAGWLIDRAGWKGYRDGPVGIHARQALILINLGGATADEILQLSDRIITDVESKFGIRLSMEVNVL
ncbi:UDP-N-acetylmuramate dehydrogenase [uncultured Rikenella sp.]|uniref:UDP-N-acetylmuramate dehydrogenase n=1 Tax=uncultured Rikenella sp. TaxID=368003 RepID=UPI0025CD0D0C|nr:UDP-N-acetylmuramate dehydrogenase [uncultured Rikenella sp.]